MSPRIITELSPLVFDLVLIGGMSWAFWSRDKKPPVIAALIGCAIVVFLIHAAYIFMRTSSPE